MSPECPCCGGTTARAVQRISGGLLRGLWRAQFGVDTGRIETTTLHECDCGLRFFSPAAAGDAAFYGATYATPPFQAWMRQPPESHADFRAAMPHIHPGDRVLDVGGHGGSFATLVERTAHCTVIDPYADAHGLAGALPETAAEHAARLPGHYDVVTAFQVIEHVEQPVALARDMLACLRPGGRLVLAGPTWPSMLTRIPNMAMNAPPHHLAWWSPAAFRALASRLGLEVLEARDIAGTPALRRVYRALRLLMPEAPTDRPFHHSWWLHGRMALAGALRHLPPRLLGDGPAEGTDVILVARKP